MGRFLFDFEAIRCSAQAYFEEDVPGSQIESKRVRKCMLYYYLEDDCLQVFEPAEENSGLPQGCLVRRHRVPKPDGSYYGMADLQIGAVIDVYRKLIHIYDCDDFTRKTLTERGLPVSNRLPSPTKQQLQGYTFDDELTVVTRNTEQVSLDEGSSLFPGCVPEMGDALECPDDEYRAMMRTKRAENGLDQSISRRKVISPEIGGAREAQLGRAQVTVDLGLPQRTDLGTFLENDRKVLSFECTWEDKALYGDVSRFRLHYFLAEDAIEVIAVDKRSDDSAPKLLGKRKLLLPQYQHSVNTPTDKTNTYHWTDLAVGGEVIIFNRTLKIVDADQFTRKYYEDQGSSLRDKIPIPSDDPDYLMSLRPKTPIPQHSGFGSVEDSLRSVYSISPQKKVQNTKQGDPEPVLRYQLRLVNGKREDAVRTFTLNYFLSDGTCAIREPPLRNSGHVGGSFSKRHRVKKPDRFQTLEPTPVSASSQFEAAPLIAYYEASDLYVGATIEFVGKVFEVTKCDEFTLSYMEEHQFPQSSVSSLRVASENLVRLPYTCTEADLQNVLKLTPQEAVTLARAARRHAGTDQGSHITKEAVRRVLLGI